MTTLTVLGSFADLDGHCLRAGGTSATRVSAWPAGNYRSEQPKRIAVLLGHSGPELGEVVHLEQGQRRLEAVAVVDLDRADERLSEVTGPLYWSSGARGQMAGLVAEDNELV
jgi:hypothetical protein